MKEIFIYGIIGDCDDDQDCISAQNIIDQINWTDDGELKVRINSPGGSIFEGIAIFDALNKCGKRVVTQIDGMAASMASIIAMVGEEIVISPFAQMMTHKPCGSVEGSAIEIRQKADLLDELEKTMLSIYVARTGLSEAECQAKFLSNTNSWFNAQEAVAAGLADRIEEGRLKTTIGVPATDSLVSVYKHFAAKLNIEEMDFNQVKVKLNLSAEMTEDSFYAHFAEVQAKAEKADMLALQVTELTGKVDGFEAAQVAAREQEINTLVDAAIAERRILAVAKENWIAMFKASHEAAAASLKAIAVVPDLSMIPGGKVEKTEGRETWSFSDWSKKDSKGLELMKLERQEEFKALFKAEHGVEPKI